MRIPIMSAFFLGVAAGTTAVPAVAEDRHCFETWSDAAAVVRREQLIAVEQLNRYAKAELGGSIVKATLCSVGPGYVYRLVVRLPGGLMRFMSLDARKPFER